MEYKGIRIPKEITIVEKIPYKESETYQGKELHQGYVVDAENKTMLETAMVWARTIRYPVGREKEIFEGICHTYKNGEFFITIYDSADRSSQGGKLSFWNCIIQCPDNKKFLIGINSDLLVEFILNNTLECGDCYDKVYLGRASGNVGVFTENMPSYKQFLADEKQREDCKKTTSKYEIGDIVKTLKSETTYIGTVEDRFGYSTDSMLYRSGFQREYIFYIYKTPKTLHVFKDRGLDFLKSKPKRTVVGHSDEDYNVIDEVNKYFNSEYSELTKLSYTFKGSNEELIEAIKRTNTVVGGLNKGYINSIRFIEE